MTDKFGPKTVVGITVATFISVMISIFRFGNKMGILTSEFSSMKNNINQINKSIVKIQDNQINMNDIIVKLDDRYELKK